MLICHCNIISEREIEDVVRELLDQDPWQLIVPMTVYRTLEKRGRCCGCFPNVVDIIVRVTEAYHASNGSEPERLETLRVGLTTMRRRHHGAKREQDDSEGRGKGHRAA